MRSRDCPPQNPLPDADATVPACTKRAAARREVATGYALQILSATLLLAQHFFLPVALGVAAYGRLAFMTGAASLLSIAYDHGFNLLAVRKPALAWTYLAVKLALLLTLGLFAGIWVLATQQADLWLTLTVGLHALTFVVYTFYVHVDIAIGKIRRVFWYSLANGVLLLSIPLAFHHLGADLAYAPAVGCVLSLCLLLATRPVAIAGRGPTTLAQVRLRPRRLKPLFVKQLQISLGTVLDGGIVWIGVLAVTALDGFEAAGIYRIAMSAVSLMTQVLPMPKQVLLRLARQSAQLQWARRYALGLVGSGLLQMAAVYLLGQWALQYVFPGNAEPIYHAVLALSAVPAMRALFELQTILHDKHNTLAQLVRNTCIAGACGAAAYGQGVYVMVLVFYGLLTLLGVKRLFWS